MTNLEQFCVEIRALQNEKLIDVVFDYGDAVASMVGDYRCADCVQMHGECEKTCRDYSYILNETGETEWRKRLSIGEWLQLQSKRQTLFDYNEICDELDGKGYLDT